jgi:putative ABC transport system permease protein
VPLAQREPREWNHWREAVLTIKAAPGQRALVERDVAGALTQADPTIVFTSGTFDQIVDATVTRERLIAMMSGFFGALALVLAGLGLYGVVAQAVGARRTEIGLRMALGAEPGDVLRLVLREGMRPVAAGILVGLGGAAILARVMKTLLFGVDALDPVTFGAVAAALACVALAACYLPARRAMTVDPANTLR